MSNYTVRGIASIIPFAICLSACAGPNAPSYKLEPPRAALMKAPEPLPDIPEGQDLYEENARLRASYARTADKAVGLQKYVRVILKKQKGSP